MLAKRFQFRVYCYVNRQECAKQAVSILTKKMLCRQMNRKFNVPDSYHEECAYKADLVIEHATIKFLPYMAISDL